MRRTRHYPTAHLKYLLPLFALTLGLLAVSGTYRIAHAASGTIQFASTEYQVTEGNQVQVTVNRPGGDGQVWAAWTLSAGPAVNATAHIDYINSTGTVDFQNTETTDIITLTTLEDGDAETTENFTITLSSPSTGATIGTNSTAKIVILDDDGPPSFTANNPTVREDIGTAVVTITRSGGNITGAVSVDVSTANDSAVAPGDYTAFASQTVNFASGETSKTVNVTVINDSEANEGDQSLDITLDNALPTGGSLTNGSLTIKDDDNGIIKFTSATFSVVEGDVTATLNLTRTGGSSGTVSVQCDTISGGTASSPGDYTAFTDKTVTFDAGETTESCDVVIKEDTVIEGDETVNARIDTPSGGALIGDQDTTVLTIQDDEQDSDIQFSAANYTVTEGVAAITITVTRSGDTSQVATVNYATSAGTALATADYTHTTGTLTFAASITSKTFSVSITNDTTLESVETFGLTLSNPTNAGLGAPSTATGTINDNDGIAPVVTSVGPNHGLPAGGTAVTITGANFTGATAVKFGGVSGTDITVDTDLAITVKVPAHIVGSVSVTVANTHGTSNTNIMFHYSAGQPAVSALNPATGPIAGGTTVAITGVNLADVTVVKFGATLATSFVKTGDTLITAIAPAHVAGTVDVIVTNPSGDSTNTSLDNYVFVAQSTFTYTLHSRWSLIVWAGPDEANAQNALKGIETPENPLTNNVWSQVSSIYTWHNGLQAWLGYFPAGVGVPGANDFTTLKKGVAYWFAIVGPGSIQWTIIES